MSNLYTGMPENQQVCPAPPYNATNFTTTNSTIYSTLIYNALTQPQYPLPTGSNAQQIYLNTQNISFFTAMNKDTQYAKATNTQYPQFRSEAQRLMYIQGQTMAAARNKFTGLNPTSTIGPSGAAGVPCSSIYGIIAPPYS